MNTLYFTSISVQLIEYVIGNQIKWGKVYYSDNPTRRNEDSEYNSATLILTIITLVGLIAIVFLADSILIGLVSAILMFTIVNKVISKLVFILIKTVMGIRRNK